MNIRNYQGSLLSDTVRVSAPFIKVDIGGYSFGVYEEREMARGKNGIWRNVAAKFPNYIQSLNIKKINGTVNTYTATIIYPITKDDDPNFFEKIFSKVSSTRKIKFTYGDSMLPEDVYANEEALITEITSSIDLVGSRITYTVKAIGDTAVSMASQYSWRAVRAKPSYIIASILQDSKYKLYNIFPGMKNKDPYDFIAADDKEVNIPTVTNKSVMDYISTLVSYMVPNGSSGVSVIQNNLYSLATYEDVNGIMGGPYFEVRKIQNNRAALDGLCSYNIDIGYPTADIIEDFSVKTNNNWSLFYNYNRSASSMDYVKRLNSKGELEYVYTPQLTNGQYDLEENDKTWWTRVTEFPIEASLKIKGLLRPAMLMNYVKINVWFWGQKYITSGYYIITGEEDVIDYSGYHTTLSLVRVAGEGTEFTTKTTTSTPRTPAHVISTGGGVAGGGSGGGGSSGW